MKQQFSVKNLQTVKYLVAVLDMKNLKVDIFKTLSQDKRQIYVISNDDGHLISSINYEKRFLKAALLSFQKS